MKNLLSTSLFIFILLNFASGQIAENNSISKDNFTYEPDQMHYIMLIIKNRDQISIQEVKSDIEVFIEKHNQGDPIKMSILSLDKEGKRPVLLLRSFENKQVVMQYFLKIIKNQNELSSLKILMEALPVSINNYKEILQAESTETYKDFFKMHYL